MVRMKLGVVFVSGILLHLALATTEQPTETTTARLHRSTFQEQTQWTTTTPLPTTNQQTSTEDQMNDDQTTINVDDGHNETTFIAPANLVKENNEQQNNDTTVDVESSERALDEIIPTQSSPHQTSEQKTSIDIDSELTTEQEQLTTSETFTSEPSANGTLIIEISSTTTTSTTTTTETPTSARPEPSFSSTVLIPSTTETVTSSDLSSKIRVVNESSRNSINALLKNNTSTNDPLKNSTSTNDSPKNSTLTNESSRISSSSLNKLPVKHINDSSGAVMTESPNTNAPKNISSDKIDPEEASDDVVEALPLDTSISLADVTPEPKINELSLNSNKETKQPAEASVEELPAQSMMALKASPLVEFSYKQGTPKPPSKGSNAQKEPARPIGEITEDDQVIGQSESVDTEPASSRESPQPDGILKVASLITKMIQNQVEHEGSRSFERPVNKSEIPVPQTTTARRPEASTLDYEFPSLETMRSRAREHNGKIDHSTDSSSQLESRSQDSSLGRTSKIMNAPTGKDKMIFIKTVPKGSLTTTEPSSMATMISTTESSGSESGAQQSFVSTESTSTAKTTDDDYYDEPTEIVNEDEVIPASDTGLPAHQSHTEERTETSSPKPTIEDTPVMALVIQNPPNENSLTRKDLKPLDTENLQVSFVLPAVTEPAVESNDKVDKPTPGNDDRLPVAGTDGSAKGVTLEAKYGKPYPMQRVTTTTRPPSAVADERVDSSATQNPMTTLAGGEAYSGNGEFKLACPPKEDIHPCTCVTHEDEFDSQEETVATCRGIKHTATLIEALRGFRNHHLTYLIIDNSNLPPFPNNILHRIQVDWMEVLNTPVQFKRDYLQCSIKCTLS